MTQAPMSRSSRGLGHRPFTAVTRVRIPYETPAIKKAPAGFAGAFLLLVEIRIGFLTFSVWGKMADRLWGHLHQRIQSLVPYSRFHFDRH